MDNTPTNRLISGDYLIEYGAQWAAGQGGNIVYHIAEPYGVFEIQSFKEAMQHIKRPDSKINMTQINNFIWVVSDFFEDAEKMNACNCSEQYYFDKR